MGAHNRGDIISKWVWFFDGFETPKNNIRGGL